MKKVVLSLLIVLILVPLLAACGGLDIQAEPTPAPVESSTPSPVPTNTPEPTHTPLPTVTPKPTLTITPTPAPQIGDMRTDPETGEEQVFSDAGEWVDVVQVWDVEERGPLPLGITPENGRFEINDDGGAALIFILDDPHSPDHGKEFEYLIPAMGESELLDYYGDMVPVVFDGLLYADKERRPAIRMIDDHKNRLAMYDLEDEEWLVIYSNILTDLGQQELAYYMPEELGSDGMSTDESMMQRVAGPQTTRMMDVLCKPVRLFEWRIVNSRNELTHITTIMETACNEEEMGNIYVPVWDSSGSLGWDRARIFEYSLTTESWVMTPHSAPRKTKEQMMTLPAISPRVNVYLVVYDEGMTNSDRPGAGDWTESFENYAPGDSWWRVAMANDENYDKQVRWVEDVHEKGASELEGVIFGANELSFLTDEDAGEE